MNALPNTLSDNYWKKFFVEASFSHITFNLEPTGNPNQYNQTDGLKKINIRVNLN